MIEITHSNNRITIKGHAKYDVIGKDIVCAGVSSLTYAFIESVEQLTNDKLKCFISAGNAVIEYGDLSEEGELLINSFFIGLRMIAEEYPDNVKIEQALNS